MPLATHIIRFIAVEDGQLHLGQPTDISRDVGLATYHQEELKAYLINGDIYNPELTSIVLTVRQLLAPIQVDDCLYVRCMGLNYSDHASVSIHSP